MTARDSTMRMGEMRNLAERKGKMNGEEMAGAVTRPTDHK